MVDWKEVEGELDIEALPGMEGVVNPLDEAQLRSEAARKVFEASEGAAPWLEDYWALRAEGWPWRQAVYLVWAAQPKESRWPKTQHELAVEVLGLTSDRVIRDWKVENPAMEVRIAQLAINALSKARAEIYAALIKSACRSDPRAHSDRKLALEMLGDYLPRQRMDLAAAMPDDLAEMDAEELRALAGVPGVKSKT